MTDLLRDAIASGLAELEAVAQFPSEPYGYGTDMSCASDLTDLMEDVDPVSTLAVAQALVRRLDCPRGALPGDATYGYDLRGRLNRGLTEQELRTMAGQINGELLKDDRVDSLSADVAFTAAGSDTLRVALRVRPIDPLIGGFALTLSASSAAVLIEELSA